MKLHLASFLVLLVVSLALIGCSSPTGNSTSSGSGSSTSSSTTSTVYSVTATGSSNLKAQLGFSLASAKASGTKVSVAKLTYAADSTYLNSTPGTPGWEADGSWAANFTTFASATSTWVTETCSATLTASSSVAIDFYMNSGHWYVKEVDFTYTDGATEKLTFTTTSGSPVHSVYTAVGGTVTTVDEALNWTYFDSGLSSVSNGVTTVSF